MMALVEACSLHFRVEDGVEYAREQLRALKPPPESLPALRIQDRIISYGSVSDIHIRVYWPRIEQQDTLPVVVFYHGGGWAIGDLDIYDGAARAHALGAEAIVVSVGYRLAPEHPYPSTQPNLAVTPLALRSLATRRAAISPRSSRSSPGITADRSSCSNCFGIPRPRST